MSLRFIKPLLERFIRACGAGGSACLLFCLWIAVLLPAGTGWSAESVTSGYLVELQRLARDKGLDRAREWEVLLHYKPKGSGMRSLVDDPRFFNAQDGQYNPTAELDATLASFFRADVSAEEEHPQCKFIARFTWLKEQLGIDPTRLPPADCAKLNKALAEVKPRSIVLVFPNTLVNHPSSMFGHTLIRINTAYESDLLSHAVNYAAITGDNIGIFYVFRGIFGFYKGRYSNLPYYAKVQEYSDIEHRDIWEYHLNLTPEEAYRSFLHVWEMKDFYSDYYFFDQNCSFNLLFLIEAGRPSLRLTDEFFGKARFWVIPVDTIRAVQKFGIVERVTFRPSRATKILRISSGMSSDLKQMTFDVVDAKKTPKRVLDTELAVEDKRAVLDLSAELTQYRYSSKKLDEERYKKQFLEILASRSTLGVAPTDPYAIERPTPPDQGHLSARIRTGGGYRSNSWFGEFEWRAAYHDITDLDEGYVAGAQINFMDLSFRYYADDEKVRLHRWHVIDILSLSPWNGIFRPVSWKVNAGADELTLADGRDHPVARLNAGGGLSASVGSRGIAYLLAEADLHASTKLDKDYALGFGATGGVMVDLTGNWKLNLRMQGLSYRIGDRHQTVAAAMQHTLRLSTNRALSLDMLRERSFDVYKTDMTLRTNWYF